MSGPNQTASHAARMDRLEARIAELEAQVAALTAQQTPRTGTNARIA